MKIFHVGSHQFWESLRELLRELWFSYCSSREIPFREWNFVFRERNFEFRELLREYPGTLRELREWPFHSESVFPEIGVVPRLLIRAKQLLAKSFQNFHTFSHFFTHVQNFTPRTFPFKTKGFSSKSAIAFQYGRVLWVQVLFDSAKT